MHRLQLEDGKIYLAVTYGKQAELGKKKVLEDYLKKMENPILLPW